MMTVWPFATRTEVLTSRFEVIGVALLVVVWSSSMRCSISSATRLPLLMCGVTVRMRPTSLYS